MYMPRKQTSNWNIIKVSMRMRTNAHRRKKNSLFSSQRNNNPTTKWATGVWSDTPPTELHIATTRLYSLSHSVCLYRLFLFPLFCCLLSRLPHKTHMWVSSSNSSFDNWMESCRLGRSVTMCSSLIHAIRKHCSWSLYRQGQDQFLLIPPTQWIERNMPSGIIIRLSFSNRIKIVIKLIRMNMDFFFW